MFFIFTGIQRDVIVIVRRSLRKMPVVVVRF